MGQILRRRNPYRSHHSAYELQLYFAKRPAIQTMLGALKPSAYLAKTKFSFRRECSMEKTEVRYWEIIADNLSKSIRLELGSTSQRLIPRSNDLDCRCTSRRRKAVSSCVRRRFSVYCGGHALRRVRESNDLLLSNSCNSLAILRCKKSEQYHGRGNLLNLGLRSHNLRARDDDHSY